MRQPTTRPTLFACAFHSTAALSLSCSAMRLHCKGLERRALHVLNLACRACVILSFGCRSSSPASTVASPQAARSSRLLKPSGSAPAARSLKLHDMINESTASCTDAKPRSNTSMQHASPQHASPQHASPHYHCCRSLRAQRRAGAASMRRAPVAHCTLVALMSHSRCAHVALSLHLRSCRSSLCLCLSVSYLFHVNLSLFM